MRSITIDNDTRELTRLMSFTEELAKEYRLSHEEVMQLQLALEEVVVNIISYFIYVLKFLLVAVCCAPRCGDTLWCRQAVV